MGAKVQSLSKVAHLTGQTRVASSEPGIVRPRQAEAGRGLDPLNVHPRQDGRAISGLVGSGATYGEGVADGDDGPTSVNLTVERNPLRSSGYRPYPSPKT